MKHRAVLWLVAMMVIYPLAASLHAQQTPEEQAQKAAEAWLAEVDAAQYADSWQNASAYFKSAVTREHWIDMVGGVRKPLGKVQSRKLKSAQYTTTLPGAPDGEYVVIQYDTSFEKKAAAIETLAVMLDKDGKWHVSGYFIK